MDRINRQQIIDELTAERDTLNEVLDLLKMDYTIIPTKISQKAGKKPRKPMSQEARDRISAAQKKRWAKKAKEDKK